MVECRARACAVLGCTPPWAKDRGRACRRVSKTYTAASFCYRLIKFARAKRILFLVDRNNLGRQTLNEFQQYTSPYINSKFTEEYVVQHLRRNTIDPASKVCITRIQRLYSMLKGEEEFDETARSPKRI
jgi:type I restriction enzyme R subunit